MERDFYTTPKSNFLMRLLWKASGADRHILERSTYSDQVKYTTLGGIIVATGVMAGLAGGYAFYTIFGPKGSAIESEFDLNTMLMSIGFGIVWGLMIFNLDRFIVSSTGKGDGTEAITWNEFKGAIPRIIMGAIIALTISKPIEIRMFKTEIDVKLYEKQLELEKIFKQKVDANFADREALLDKDLAKIEGQKKRLTELLEETLRKKNEIAQKTVTRYRERVNSKGEVETRAYEATHPSLKIYQESIDRITNDIENFEKVNAARLKAINIARDNLEKEKIAIINTARKQSAALDGLLQRIHLAHEVAGFWISLFITLLFMAIELTPIFFKLMLIKSPYDYLKDNVEDLIKAEQGIYVESNFFKDKEGQERDLVVNLHKEKVIAEKKALQTVQQELTEYAVNKYREQMKRRIDLNPEEFIKSGN